MSKKVAAKYTIVKLSSCISGTTRTWLKERSAPSVTKILFDPAIGQEVMFEEKERIKGKSTLKQSVKDKFGITDEFNRQAELEEKRKLKK